MSRSDPRPHYGRKWRITDDGYVDIYAPGHSLARSDGYVFEHRMVAWDAGLFNDPDLEVHHRNYVKWDNEASNLQPLTKEEHARLHAAEGTYNQYGTFARRDENHPKWYNWYAPKASRVCKQCGDKIPTSKRRDAKFCSSDCRNRWHVAQR